MPNPVLARRLHAAVRYLLLARFGADIAAPLPTPLPVDVGNLTVTDTNGVMSQAGGVLVVNGALASGDRLTAPATAFARLAGRALLFAVPSRTTISAGNVSLGLDDATADSTSLDHAVDLLGATTWRARANSAVLDTQTYSSGSWSFAFVLRSTGALLLARDGGSGPYTLAWVFGASTTSEFLKFRHGAATHNYTLDDLRVLDLGAPWNSDYGMATARLTTTSASSTLTAMSDAVIEHTITAATGVTQELHVRRQDATNKWIVRMAAPGTDTIKLIELVANVETERASSAQTFTNATQYRVVVTCEGATIKTFVADVAKNSYASASNFQTATGVLVDTAGTDLVAWPRTLALPQGV